MAATSVGQIGLDLVVNQNQFQKQMSGITGLAKKAGAALAAAFAVKKVVSFGKECLQLGSDLTEVQNVVDVTFPHMTAQVDQFAKSAAASFGLSETMAKQYTGTFGAMAKAFGFSESAAYDMGTSLTGLAGDVASFYNLSQDEAYTKLKSVFTGETETLKDLGVVMTQNALDAYAMANGFGKTTQAMTEAEKVALRYQFVQSQLSAAQGDFARTSDSWANQTRILKLQFDSLKATLGQGFINLFTPVLKVINTLLGKLTTLANAFKSFTELITGKKSSGSSAAPVADVADTAGNAASGLDNASGAADNLSDSTNGVGKAAKKAAKEMKSLMGFDQIQKIDDNSSADSTDDTSSPGTGAGGGSGLGGAVDYGNLAQGETVLDKVDSKFSGLIKRVKELAGLFKQGFKIGFGDSEKKIDSIKNHLNGIKKSLTDIFTDNRVVTAANNMFDSIALNAGKVAGAVASNILTIADNLVGGFDKYLQKSKDFIKDRLVSIFDVTGEIAGLIGDYEVAWADIFSVFSGENAKNCTASIIGIFSDSFIGALDLALQFGRDIIDSITAPFIENKDKIKEAIDNTLAPISQVLGTLHQAVKDTFAKFQQVYDEHIRPMLASFRDGISDIVGKLLDGYNTYIAPVLDRLAEKFESVWKEHIQPAIDSVIELFGKIADGVRKVWEETLQPFLAWVAENIMPVLAPIFEGIGGIILNAFGIIGDVISNLMDALGGIIDFLVGVFTGNWELAWTGIKEFFSGIWNGIKDFLSGIWDAIKELFAPVANWFKQKFQAAKDGITSVFANIGNWFKEKYNAIKTVFSNVGGWFKEKFTGAYSSVKNAFSGAKNFFSGIWSGIKNAFGNITGWFKDKFSNAWQAVKDVFSSGGRVFEGIKDGILESLKAVINGLISGINNVVSIPFDGINWALDNLRNVSIAGFYPFDWLPSIGVPQIPYLAQGGYVKPNTPQLAMIGDNRHQGEVVAPEDKMLEMVNAAVKAAGAGGITREELESIINHAVMRIVSALMEIGFSIDGETIAKAKNMAQTGINRRFNAVDIV
ncbi:hypothetical protein [Ruminococcus gauvreauii]|uniref:phage tail protein n=1 Tax=Ruminococcus gauvreauii TaxID=438033 RepID=UPI003983EF0A